MFVCFRNKLYLVISPSPLESFTMGKAKKWSTPKPGSKPSSLPAQGDKNGPKRTPRHVGDSAAGRSLYHVQDIIAERLSRDAKGNSVKEWLVRWEGFTPADDTWEGLANLAGCEAFIARFEEEKDRRNKELEETTARKRDAAAAAAAAAPEATTAVLIAPTGKKTSWVWKAFVEAKDPQTGDKVGICQLKKRSGEPCGDAIKICGGTTNLAAHLERMHKDWYIAEQLKAPPLPKLVVDENQGIQSCCVA